MTQALGQASVPACGVHSLEAGDGHKVCRVRSTAMAFWEESLVAGVPRRLPYSARGARQGLLPGPEGWITIRGIRKGRLGGNVKGCCRHEPVPLISQRKREVQSGEDACPGSHRQCPVSPAVLLLFRPHLCASQTLSGSWTLLSLNPLSFL